MAEKFVRQIAENTWVCGHRDSAAVVTQGDLNVQEDIGDIKKVKNVEIMSWGKQNTLPRQRELVIRNNNVVGELIATKRDLTLGQGLYAYKKVRKKDDYGRERYSKEEVEMPNQSADFFERVNIQSEDELAAGEYFMHENIFTQFVMKKKGRIGSAEIESMQTKRCRHIRAAKQDSKGKVNKYYWNGSWEKKKKGYDNVITINAYDPKEDKPLNFLHHAYDQLFFDDYYGHPKFWGAKNWISLANAIPLFHLNNLENSYNIRFHIEIPRDYFADTTVVYETEELQKEAVKAEAAARQAFMDEVNEFLAGLENAGRALFTSFDYNEALGKLYPGIKITPLDYDMKDEALIKLFEASNKAALSSLGVHPTLAAIESQGKLSSGSEMRNAFNIYLGIKTVSPRQKLISRIDIAKKLEGWPSDICYEYRDIEILKLDEEKAGKREKTEM